MFASSRFKMILCAALLLLVAAGYAAEGSAGTPRVVARIPLGPLAIRPTQAAGLGGARAWRSRATSPSAFAAVLRRAGSPRVQAGALAGAGVSEGLADGLVGRYAEASSTSYVLKRTGQATGMVAHWRRLLARSGVGYRRDPDAPYLAGESVYLAGAGGSRQASGVFLLDVGHCAIDERLIYRSASLAPRLPVELAEAAAVVYRRASAVCSDELRAPTAS